MKFSLSKLLKNKRIKIINKLPHISEEYIVSYPNEISINNLEELLFNQMDEYRISNIKIKEDFIIIISTKISKNTLETNSADKNININGFDIRIINLNFKKDRNPNEKLK